MAYQIAGRMPRRRHFRRARIRRLFSIVAVCLAIILAQGSCTQQGAPPPVAAGSAEPLVVSLRAGEFPPYIFTAFTAATGVPVQVVGYEMPNGGEELLRSGSVTDVTLVDNRSVAILAADGLLAPLNFRHLHNFKNISPNFRDLSYDPGNRYSIPFAWGASGIVARADLVTRPITSWSDLWDPVYCGRIGVWVAQKRAVIGAALRTLGYSANSQDPDELAAAREQLRLLKPCVHVVTGDDIIRYLPAAIRGDLMVGVGNPHEAYSLRTFKLPFRYYLPEEGTLLWGDSLVIPATSRQPDLAAQFIDFLLRPEIGAEIANANFFQVTNEAAYPFIKPELREDPMLYPPVEVMRKAEILLPLSDEAAAVYDKIWQEFIAGPVE